MNLKSEIDKLITNEVSAYIYSSLGKKSHKCLEYKTVFRVVSKYNYFCSKKCYQRHHRLRGYVKRVVNTHD